jgi:hypothetical protein
MMLIRVPISARTYGNLNGRSATQRSGAILRGEHRGWIAIQRVSGCLNHYALLTPAKPMAVVEAKFGRGPTANSMAGGPLPNTKWTTANKLAVKKRRTAKKERKGEESDSPPGDFFVGEKEEATEEGKTSPNSAPSARGEKKSKSDWRVADRDEAFARFWAVYPKREGIDAARKAFARVIKSAADAETAIRAGTCYAIQRQRCAS